MDFPEGENRSIIQAINIDNFCISKEVKGEKERDKYSTCHAESPGPPGLMVIVRRRRRRR